MYVSVYSEPDSHFQRQGVDLWHTVTLDVTDAVLGTEIKVPTLEKKLHVKIPPGTQPDDVLRLHGEGLPYFKGDRRGDLKLRIQIAIPEQLTGQQKKLYEQLRSIS